MYFTAEIGANKVQRFSWNFGRLISDTMKLYFSD